MTEKTERYLCMHFLRTLMQLKLLNDIVGNIIGKQASEIVELLVGKKNMNEFIIAKKLKLTINQTRNILYKLADVNLVSFTRKKDKKKGWYTYFWTLEIEKALELLDSNISAELENLKNQLKSRETKRFYVCNTCKVELSEETALLHNFTCQECGSVYDLQTDKKIVNDLHSRIAKYDVILKSIREELDKITVKETKKKERVERKELKAVKAKKAKKKVIAKKVKKVKKAKKKR